MTRNPVGRMDVRRRARRSIPRVQDIAAGLGARFGKVEVKPRLRYGLERAVSRTERVHEA